MDTTTSSLCIRRAGETDVSQLKLFYRRLFPDRPRLHNMEVWRWEFLRNPHACGKVPFFVLEKAGEVHGGIGYVPLRLQLDERIVEAVHPVNHFVDPAFKGLPALRLMRYCLSDSKVAFFSNLSSDAVRLAKATGFVDLSQHLEHYYLPLGVGDIGSKITNGWLGRMGGYARHASRKVLYAGARAYCLLIEGRRKVEVSSQLPKLDHLLVHSAKNGRYCVIKDEQYLFWRYESSPRLNCIYVTILSRGEITGMAVVHLDRKGSQAVILDILITSQGLSQLLCLMVAVIDYCRREGASVLSTTIMHPEIGKVLKILGFGHMKSDYCFMVYAEDKALKQELSDYRRWEFFLGDTDVY